MSKIFSSNTTINKKSGCKFPRGIEIIGDLAAKYWLSQTLIIREDDYGRNQHETKRSEA